MSPFIPTPPSISVLRLRFLLLVLGLFSVAAASLCEASPQLTSIKLGDENSEKAAGLTAVSAPLETKPDVALGETGRRLVPASENDAASIAFEVTVDPDEQSYLTLRLWGSDTTWTPVNLFAVIAPASSASAANTNADTGSINLGNLWWHVTREAPVPGRFLYRTFPIPIEVTRGKTSLRLRMETAAAPQKIGAFRNSDSPLPKLSYRPSFAVYGLYSHTSPWFQPAAAERQGAPFVWGPPVPKPEGYPDATEERLLERAKADIKGALSYNVMRSVFETGHRYDTRVLATLSLIYNTEWSGHYQDKAVAEKVRDAVDIHVRRQAAQGGDPGKMFYRGWDAHGLIAFAFSQISQVFQDAGWLDQSLTLDTAAGPVTLTRRQAYADFFHDAFEWRRLDGRSFTNQPIYVSHTLYRLQKALRATGDSRALTEAQARHYVHVAVGLQPMRTRGSGIDAANAGYPYYLTTRAGLTREKGYVDGYGELSYVLVQLAEETGDPAVYDFARKFMRTRSVFRIPTNDTAGHGALRGIGAISWRGTTFPFKIAYSGIEEAAILEDPVSLRLAQLEIAHGRLHLLGPQPERGPHWTPAGTIRQLNFYRKIKALPPSAHRIPTEPGRPDFVWSDPENGVFVFRHGSSQVYGSFFNLDPANGRAIGDRGLVHLIRPETESLIEFPPTSQTPESGLSITVEHPYGKRVYKQVPPPPGMKAWHPEPPEHCDKRAGRAYFYWQRFGPYVVAMNTTETGTYRESAWTLPAITDAGAGADKARDLATGEIVDLTKPLSIPAYTTHVFVLP